MGAYGFRPVPPKPGLVSHLPHGRMSVLLVLEERQDGRGKWTEAWVVRADLGLSWKGATAGVAQVLVHCREKGWVESRVRIVRDERGNEMTSNLEWRLTRKGRAHLRRGLT